MKRGQAPGHPGRLPIVGVMGSGVNPHTEWSEPVGRFLARKGCHLLTGGGGGVMEAVSRAFHETSGRKGLVLGILPGGRGSAYPNRWVEIPVRTHLPLSGDRGREPMSRNHINVLTSDLVVALPGGTGTESEVALALEYGRRLIVAAGEGAPKRSPAPGMSLAGNPAEMEALIGEALDRWEGSGSTVADDGA